MKTAKVKKSKIRLGVNIDHAATLRQVRGGETSYPNLLSLATICKKSGADQITIHVREDRRHVQVSDLADLTKQRILPVNLEMAADPKMLKLALKYKPDWVCFVPEKRQELTTEGGLDVVKHRKVLAQMTSRLQQIGIEVSMFIEPDVEQVRASFEVGADAIEFHTGKWVKLDGKSKLKEWDRLKIACELTRFLEMGVHAGHGLDYEHTKLIKSLPHLEEVNIGHSIICYSLEEGIGQVVKNFNKILK